MYRYVQINTETGQVVGDSYLSGPVAYPHMIPIPDDFDLAGKKYVDGKWVEDAPVEPAEPEPTEQELINAEMLLNQATILSNQEATDEVLAEILLNQVGG